MYQYQPLNEACREFRVLRLLQAQLPKSEETGRMNVQMQTLSLDNHPKYTALSYCWGRGEASHNIHINDCAFAIRPNLYGYLRLRQAKQDSRPIFIDAVCINQADLSERSTQVRLMGDVYRSAAEVTAWLGSASAEEESQVNTSLLRLGAARSPLDDRLQTVVEYFGATEYWSRLWVVQEVALASKLILQRGRTTIAAKSLLQTLDAWLDSDNEPGANIGALYNVFPAVLAAHPTPALGNVDRVSTWRIASARNVLLFRQTRGMRDGRQLTLARAVGMFGHHLCTNLHDKVYGLLGITTASVVVDYSMSLSELYVRALLEAEGHPSALSVERRSIYEEAQEDVARLALKHFLALAFGWSTRHPTVVLLNPIPQCSVWAQVHGHFDLEFSRMSLSLGPGMYHAVAYPIARVRYLIVQAQLRLSKARDAVMQLPGGDGEARRYSEWLILVERWKNQACELMSTSQYAQQQAQREEECNRRPATSKDTQQQE